MEKKITYTKEAIEYLAKLSQGGMRDALTMLDKCLAYSNTLTLDTVVTALGVADFTSMCQLLKACACNDKLTKMEVIDTVYTSGKDLKQYIKSFTNFVLDYNKWLLEVENYLDCPLTDEIKETFEFAYKENLSDSLLVSLIKLQTDIKWDANPKSRIEAWCFTGV